MLIEASSVLHEMAWRKEISAPRAKTMLDRLLSAPVQIQTPDGLVEAAWRVADNSAGPRPMTRNMWRSRKCPHASS
jgi:hypothetical protein